MMQGKMSEKEDATASKQLDLIMQSSGGGLLEGQSSTETVSGHSSVTTSAGEALMQFWKCMGTRLSCSGQEMAPSGSAHALQVRVSQAISGLGVTLGW